MNRYRFYEIIQAAERGEDLSKFVPANAPEAALLADLLTVSDDSGGIVKLVEKVMIDTIQPIPTSGTFDYIVFNTALSESEVVDIIKNANLTFNDYLGVMSLYIVCSNESAGITLAILDAGTMFGVTDAYAIAIMGNDEVVLFATSNLKDSFGFSGWNTEVFAMLGGNVLPAGIEAESTAMGFPVGLQNEAIKQIINCGGSIVDTGEVRTVKELSGEYHLENYTFTPESTTTYNILDLTGEKTETKKEGTLLVSNPDTLVEKIYFNTVLDTTEVIDILSKLTYINNTDIYPIPIYIIYANADLTKCIVVGANNGFYAIAESNYITGDFTPLFIFPEEQGMVGWLLQNKEYPMGQAGISRVDMLGLDIGDQNDKLISLISMNTDFEEVTTIKKVFPKEINVNTKLFEEQINTLTYANKQLTSEKEQLTSENEQLTSENERLTSDLAETTKNTMYAILKGTFSCGTIEFPSTISTVRPYMFYDWNMDRITFSGFINPSIGEYAFSKSDIRSIDIPDNVVTICEGAFKDCYYLYSVTLPDKLRTIESEAFYNCSHLTSISIPDDVSDIGDSTFAYCSSLESIVVSENNQYYDSRNNCNAIIETSTNKLIVGCKNTVIPDGVTSIGDNAFYSHHYLTSITIPDSVTDIGDYAFCNCSRLANVVIPNSVTDIGDDAFRYCGNLTSITIPDGVVSIGKHSFSQCSRLASIIIPNSVISIGGDTHDEEGNVVDITASNPLTECESLESIAVSENNQYYDSRNNCNAIIETSTNKLIVGCKNTVIPDGVTSIGDNAFYGAKSLTSIIIPVSVTSIGYLAFSNCTSLTDIYYRGTEEQWNTIDISASYVSLGNATIHFNYEG